MTTKTKQATKTKAPDIPKALKSDPQHPEIHPERHASSGMSELPTAGGSAPTANKDEAAGGTAGEMQRVVEPRPGYGVTLDNERITRSTSVADADAKHVYSYEQALTLPVVDKGTAVKMPSDAELKTEQKKTKDTADAAAKRRNDRKKNDDSPDEAEDTPLPAIRRPVIAFKDRDRRTLLVVKTADGLGAMPARAFKDVEAPNA